ncbi:MAG: hypothetical protein ORN53_00890 [Crocinitomicaceae bacterium]|nr:hypothetical protein [Crocinitomicaceae bacterium]
MKKHQFLFLLIVAISLVRCSGADSYRGSWKAVDMKGKEFVLDFQSKKFSIKDGAGKKETFTYKQHSVSIVNSVSTYGIQLGDGRKLIIHFPFANKDHIALLKDENGLPLYTLCRREFLSYEDIYKL